MDRIELKKLQALEVEELTSKDRLIEGLTSRLEGLNEVLKSEFTLPLISFYSFGFYGHQQNQSSKDPFNDHTFEVLRQLIKVDPWAALLIVDYEAEARFKSKSPFFFPLPPLVHLIRDEFINRDIKKHTGFIEDRLKKHGLKETFFSTPMPEEKDPYLLLSKDSSYTSLLELYKYASLASYFILLIGVLAVALGFLRTPFFGWHLSGGPNERKGFFASCIIFYFLVVLLLNLLFPRIPKLFFPRSSINPHVLRFLIAAIIHIGIVIGVSAWLISSF